MRYLLCLSYKHVGFKKKYVEQLGVMDNSSSKLRRKLSETLYFLWRVCIYIGEILVLMGENLQFTWVSFQMCF